MPPRTFDELLKRATFFVDAGRQVGTAFLITDRHVLTARHVVEDGKSECTERITLTRPGVCDGRYPAERVAAACGRDKSEDFALFELGRPEGDTVDAEPIPLGVPSDSDRWKAWAFPQAQSQGWPLIGTVTFTEQTWRGGKVIQLECIDLHGAQPVGLRGASGAAVCIGGRAIGLLVADPELGVSVFSYPIAEAVARNAALRTILESWYHRQAAGIRSIVISRAVELLASDAALRSELVKAMTSRSLLKVSPQTSNDAIAEACTNAKAAEVGLCLRKLHESHAGPKGRILARAVYEFARTLLPAFEEWRADVAAVQKQFAEEGVSTLSVGGEAMVEVIMAAHDKRRCEFIRSKGRGVVGRFSLPVHQPGRKDQAGVGIDFQHVACLQSVLTHFEDVVTGDKPDEKQLEKELFRRASLAGDDAERFYVVVANTTDTTVAGNVEKLRKALPSLRIVKLAESDERDAALADFRALVNAELRNQESDDNQR